MPALPDARHERFAQLVADKHMSNAEAYGSAVDKPEMKPEVAASMVDKWFKRVDISDRIAELNAQAEAAASLSHEQLARILSKIITAQPLPSRPTRKEHCNVEYSPIAFYPRLRRFSSGVAQHGVHRRGIQVDRFCDAHARDDLAVYWLGPEHRTGLWRTSKLPCSFSPLLWESSL